MKLTPTLKFAALAILFAFVSCADDDSVIMGYPAINYIDYNKSYVHFKNLPKIMSKLNDFFKK